MRAAIITGAAGGIGAALCRSFRLSGYRVIATDLSGPAGGDAFVAADLNRFARDDEYRAEIVTALTTELGGDELHVLVNNAAVQVLGGVEALGADDWHTTLDVNLVAPFLLAQAFLGALEAAGGSVVNVSSIHERLTKPGFVAYATSKAALAGLTRAMAVDLGPRVRVNAVAPAATGTPMLEAGFDGQPDLRAELDRHHPAGRIGTPDEVAESVTFLASDRARFITGTVLGIDGGIAARLHDP